MCLPLILEFVVANLLLCGATPFFLLLTFYDENNKNNAVCTESSYCFNLQTIGAIIGSMLISVFGIALLSSAIVSRQESFIHKLFGFIGISFFFCFGISLIVYGIIFKYLQPAIDYNNQLSYFYKLESTLCFCCGTIVVIMSILFVIYEISKFCKERSHSGPEKELKDSRNKKEIKKETKEQVKENPKDEILV